MKKFLVACSGVLVLAVASCAQEGPGSPTGAAGSTGGSSSPGNAGTTGSAGNGVAGTTGQGGDGAGGSTSPGAGGSSSPGAGGNSVAGSGNPGNAGNGAGGNGNAGNGAAGSGNPGNAGNGAGGNAGSGAGGTAGSSAGRGGTTGAAGSSAGRGGAGGTAGAAGSSAGRGGSGGSAGSGGGAGGAAGALNINDIVPGLDGYYWEVTPSGNTSLSGTNYPFGPSGGGCPTGTTWDTTGYINTKPVLTVGGTAGQKYTVNVHIRGVVGTRCYTGGTPASTAVGSPTGQNNTWYAGGRQANDSIWNTMEIRVAPKVSGQANQANSAYDIYFTNSFQNSSNWCQKEASYEARYNATFPVMGGGTINLVTHDSNCRTLQNCGSVENQPSCNSSAARTIEMSGLTPAPANFNQPRTGALAGTTYYLQWIWIDVTSVTSP